MVDITNHDNEKCFALWSGGCSILTSKTKEDCTVSCPFYKPSGCEDWIRREDDGKIWMIPPEEYYATPAVESSRNGR